MEDLSNSRIDRQNILNNNIAIDAIIEKSQLSSEAILFEDKLCFTKAMVANIYEVELRTIERCVSANLKELENNGYEILKSTRLKSFISAVADVPDINVGNISNRTPQISIFDFKAFLNIGMLLSESEKAKEVRQWILNVVIEIISKKSKIGVKYINQNDSNFLFSAIKENDYRKEFTNALDLYVDKNNTYKYGQFTNMIYVSIFKENAKEYKEILKLKAKDSVRETLYSEVLNLIASYECGFADFLKTEYEIKKDILTIDEAKELFGEFEKFAHWKPLVEDCRVKMASRDFALRDAFHYRLSEYLTPLDNKEFDKFLSETDKELDRLMEENKDVLKRLKESE